MADDARPVGRPRPPVPVPVPLPRSAGPRTSAAPFAAVPSPAPEREAFRPVATALDERRPAASVLDGIPAPAAPQLSQPVPELPSVPVNSWADDDHEAPWSTGRGEIRAPRGPVGRPEGTPFVERRASRLPAAGMRPSAGSDQSPAYGDWTKPSGPGRMEVSAPVPPLPPAPPAPMTTAIPDRDVAGRRGASGLDVDERSLREDDEYRGDDHQGDRYGHDRYGADRYPADRYPADRYPADRYEDDRYEAYRSDARYEDDDRYDPESGDDLRGDRFDGPEVDAADDLDDRVPATPGPVTGTVVGGRAALRAERQAREASRQAAEAARRKATKRTGPSLDDLDERPRRPRRMLTGLLAVAAVAAAVTGVYTVTSPGTEETAASRAVRPPAAATTAPTSAPAVTAALPPLDTAPSAVEAAPATPVRVPVTVLNGTDVTGLAARVSDQIGGGGWETVEPGTYEGDDIASSTVYFAQGDEKQRQAAVQLVDQFPQLEGPVVRFFDLPEGVEAPGLVVVTAGDWKP